MEKVKKFPINLGATGPDGSFRFPSRDLFMKQLQDMGFLGEGGPSDTEIMATIQEMIAGGETDINQIIGQITGQWHDPTTGQQWTQEGGNIEYGGGYWGEGAQDPSLVSSSILEHVGAADLTPEMQQYLQSFMGESWMQGAEIMQTVTNPLWEQAQSEYADSGSDESFQDWHQDEYGTNAPSSTMSQGSGHHQGVDFSDPASVQAWMESAQEIDPDTGQLVDVFGPDVTLGGLRGISEEMIEKTEGGYYDEAREAGRGNIISQLNVNPGQLGKTLNPELVKQQMKQKYQSEALALEEGISKKQAGAQGDVMEIMTEWSDIFSTGG